MTRTEHLLTKLAEEAAELIVEVSKAKRFGLRTHPLDGTRCNRERIREEMHDLVAAYDLLVREMQLPPLILSKENIESRQKKFEEYYQVSRACNTVHERGPTLGLKPIGYENA